MERKTASPILTEAQRQLSEAQKKTEASLQSTRENYQRYLSRLLKRIKRSSSKSDTYIHIERDGAKTPERIVVNDVELSDLERYQFDAFPKHAVSGEFWQERDVTITIGELGLELIDEGVVTRKRMKAKLWPEPSITMTERSAYTRNTQTLIESRDHLTKAKAFFELLSAVDSVIRHRLTEAQAQKSASATP